MTLYPPLSSLIPTHMTITPGFQWANFDLFAPEARDKGETSTGNRRTHAPTAATTATAASHSPPAHSAPSMNDAGAGTRRTHPARHRTGAAAVAPSLASALPALGANGEQETGEAWRGREGGSAGNGAGGGGRRGWGVGEGEEFACAQSSVGAVALGLFRRLGLCVGIIASISLIRVSGV
jgi:hypothetical protein